MNSTPRKEKKKAFQRDQRVFRLTAYVTRRMLIATFRSLSERSGVNYTSNLLLLLLSETPIGGMFSEMKLCSTGTNGWEVFLRDVWK
jgi:hypothetical protein